jgi:hypothetical protein
LTGRVLRFVATADAAPSATRGLESIVLDTAWTPSPGERADVRPLRPLLLDVLQRHDPLAEAMRLVDGWAAASDVSSRLEIDGFSLWYRRRLVYWRGLHDRLIWRWVLGLLADEGSIARLELATDATELGEVAALLATREGWEFSAPPPTPRAVAQPRRHFPWPIDPILWRLGLHPAQRDRPSARTRGAALTSRSTAMRERVHALGREGGRLLVLTAPSTHQAIARGGATSTQDPFLGPVVDALRGTPLEPISLEVGTSLADDTTWDDLQAPGHERVLPGSIAGHVFDDPSDELHVEAARRDVEARLAEAFPPLDADGLDLGPWVVGGLREYARTGLGGELRQAARIGRLLAALKPSAVLTINEYSRPEWLVAGEREGIPVIAIQHGIIHPLHAGYIVPSRVGLPLASLTHLFGRYEARLLTKSSVYRPAELLVSGAPRLDLVPSVPQSAQERAAIRADLGVAPSARLVVFSSTNSVPVRATIVAAALDSILDRAWPGVHLVVKLHPAEDDGAFYPALIEGLARARGFAPPPTTIVKSIDLFELLRAADAHLGIHSTVLTDAVAAGAPNLIVTSLAGSDLLGYVAAGVARPIRNGADLLAALASPEDPGTAAARAAFLADHFAAGPSAPRIADDLLTRYGGLDTTAG